MKYGKLILLLSLGSLLFAGCSYREINQNLANAERLRIGMTKDQVLEIMGEPLVNEVYHQPDCWYYMTRVNWMDGLTTRDECMPVVFQDGKLIGYGTEFKARRDFIKP